MKSQIYEPECFFKKKIHIGNLIIIIKQKTHFIRLNIYKNLDNNLERSTEK